MPKMKTKSSAKKRFKLTGKGRVRANVAFKRHCLTAKTSKMKRQARGTFMVADVDQPAIKKFYLPYGSN
ncbi:MAG TPA: 50S ribosomal protein L35 [Rhodospirillaceae bacterium]|nr:50S ribosomal protein L35 [Rhodospirillaceae bacterium]